MEPASKEGCWFAGDWAGAIKRTSLGGSVGFGGGTTVVVAIIVEVTVDVDVVVAKTVVVVIRSFLSC